MQIVICILIFSVAIPGFSEGDPSFEVVPYHFSLPAEEVKHAIISWSQSVGYALVTMNPDENCLRISPKSDGEALEVCITPDSPLAADVTFPQGNTNTIARQVLQAVQAHADRSGPAGAPHPPVPDGVTRQAQAVVCIRAFEYTNEENQFSGFVIDTDGLILTTAHGLKHASSLTVIFNDGTKLPGRPVRSHTESDLAIIAVDQPLAHAIPVLDSPDPPDLKGTVYALGCPDNGGVVVSSGTITPPPVKVNGFPLYQVSMPIHPGSSGSPVFDHHGRLAAVIKARFRGTDSIGFLIPLSTVNAFLESSEK